MILNYLAPAIIVFVYGLIAINLMPMLDIPPGSRRTLSLTPLSGGRSNVRL